MKKCADMLRKLAAFAATPTARRLVLGLFVIQAVILVFTIRPGTPPDENNHIRFIEFYAAHSISPIFDKQKPTPNLGDKTREVDYLYHYSMSWVYRASPLSTLQTYHLIRLFSVVFALLTFLILCNLFRRLGVADGVINVALLILTNIPMMLMMSSAVNNDVLVWLGISLGLLLLVRLWKQPTASDILWLAALSVVGGLVKRDLLPMGMLFAVLGLIVFMSNTRTLLAGLRRFNWQMVVATLILIIGLGLFTERVGGNVVRYGSVAPSCEQVQGEAACYNFWASARARELARQPKHPLMPPYAFVGNWFWSSFGNITDIQTQWWRHQVKPARWLTPLLVTMLTLGVLYGIVYEKARWAKNQVSRWRTYVGLIALYYIGVNLAVNYSTYLSLRVYGIALNGRYIIPSVLVLAVLSCFYWAKLLRKRPVILAALAIAIILATIFASGLLMMLRNPQLYRG